MPAIFSRLRRLTTFSPLRAYFFNLAIIFLVEVFIDDLLIRQFEKMGMWVRLINPLILLSFLSPVLYFTFFRPLLHQYRATLQANQHMEALWKASMALTQTLELEKVFEILFDQLNTLIPHDFAIIYLLSSPTHLVMKASRGYEKNVPPNILSMEPHQNPLLEKIMVQKQSAITADIQHDPLWGSMDFIPQGHSWAGIPLVVGGNSVGFCALGKIENSFFTPRHLLAVETLIDQVSAAVQNAWLFDQLRSGREHLVQLTHQMVEVQENERRSLARELHDEVGQALVSIMLNLNLLEQQVGQNELAQQRIEEINTSLKDMGQMLHDLAVSLRPVSLDHLGLQAALRQYLEQLGDKCPLAVDFEYEDPGFPLSTEMEMIFYRIVQEATNNVIQHSQATSLSVLFRRREDTLVLMVEDNGIGFQLEEANSSSCLGLFGMRERAQLMDGELTIETSPGKGTLILVEVPCGNTNIHRG